MAIIYWICNLARCAWLENMPKGQVFSVSMHLLDRFLTTSGFVTWRLTKDFPISKKSWSPLATASAIECIFVGNDHIHWSPELESAICWYVIWARKGHLVFVRSPFLRPRFSLSMQVALDSKVCWTTKDINREMALVSMNWSLHELNNVWRVLNRLCAYTTSTGIRYSVICYLR